MLDVRLFRLRAFRSGSISIFVQFLVAFGFFFTATQYRDATKPPLEQGLRSGRGGT